MRSSFYQEVQPERDVSGDNFSKGEINFNWIMDSTGYFNPYKSYIKLRFKLYKRVSSSDVSLEKSDNIGVNMFLMENLLQQVKQYVNNICVSEIQDYVPQVSSLKNRMYKSEEHMQNYLADTNFSQAYLSERIAQSVASDLVLREYRNIPSSGGTVAVTTAGAVTFSVAQPDLQVNDEIILTSGKTIRIIARASDTSMTSHSLGTAVTAIGEGVAGWTINKVSSDNQLYQNNNANRDVRTFECIWRPCLGFYDIDEFIPCCQGLFNLRLTPNPNRVYQRAAVENGTGSNIDSGLSTDSDNSYVFSVESMNMYLLKGIGQPVVNKTLSLQMREIRCQSQNITTNSLHQKTFQIHPETQELTLAYQFSGASIVDNSFSASKFKCNGEDELKLRRFWINYGGKQLPSPIPDVELNKTTKIDYFTQRYVESLMYTNALNSPEPLRKWFERGVYFHFSGYSSEEKEDRCYVSSQFDSFTDNSVRPNVLLFDHYIKKVTIYIENSRIQDVKSY